MLQATCSHVPTGQGGTGSPTAKNPAFAGLSDAPREIRTPTVQTDHKALNLARDCPIRPTAVDTHIPSGIMDDLDLVDAAFVVTVLSRRESFFPVM